MILQGFLHLVRSTCPISIVLLDSIPLITSAEVKAKESQGPSSSSVGPHIFLYKFFTDILNLRPSISIRSLPFV